MHFLNLLFLMLFLLPLPAAAAPWKELEDADIARIAAALPAVPQGLGPRCQQRAAWQAAEVQARVKPLVARAETLLKARFPAWNDAAYLQYQQQGTRGDGERMMNARKAWIYPLVIAECAEAKGRFLPAIATALREIAAQPSWTWPAHDKDLQSFGKQDFQVDLNGADLAHDLAQALYLLGDWLTPAEREPVLRVLRERIFEPVKQSLQTGKGHSWLHAEHNWNAVCLKGVVGAALAVLPDRQERAVFAAAGQHYIRNYMAGFPADGYSTEGPSYWNYGFSHFVVLRELLASATAGKTDLFTLPHVSAVAQYGLRIEMSPGNVAPFGDAGSRQRPDPFTLAYLNEALGWGQPDGLRQWTLPVAPPGSAAPLADAALALFVAPRRFSAANVFKPDGLSSFFPDASVLVSRPAGADRLAITIKAGGKGPDGGPGANGNHSHNDIGSYAIALGDQQPTGDVGAPGYSAKTFSKARYTIRTINSYGHPVPVVAGQLQQNAAQLTARVLSVKQTEARDDITVDMAPAYAVPALKTLTRSMAHERPAGQAASITIEDRFEFTSPQDFETALTTFGTFKREADDRLSLSRGGETLRVQVEASSAWELREERIDEEGIAFTRLGIRLRAPSAGGFVRLRFLEAARP